MGRMSAQERRESVIRAAIVEFARGGYHGTSTEAIAKRVGVTQPYLFRLFPDKKAIFVAALARSTEDTRLAFAAAAEGMAGSERARHAMAGAYMQLISTHPETLLMQVQGYLFVAAAEAQGDDRIGELVRNGWMRLWESVRLPLGADENRARAFLAHGMLGNILTAIGLVPDEGFCRGPEVGARPSELPPRRVLSGSPKGSVGG
ncbi:TetR/AcrR family transcriptional regulator [Streptacidiphilus sp. EB103A]|uniref:TetR/AcrR family transcriptional regulator n=1 Tax=Streptacidiphilus sp. EB103A TaxID=3156275 RepID=UPI00351495A4